ncbi:MAG: hypothetical protein JSV52_08075 [Candidatus Zixiibacteriota bacterium]|nr:MAG: hypothetical protein JSV52_08075 [candidate division Zixibacteria bacterium]
MSPARFRWGILLIQLGVLILLANLEVINYNFLLEGLVFLAVVLIMVGIEKIFTRSRLQFISYLSSVGILAIGFLIAFNSSFGGSATCYLSDTTYTLDIDPDVSKIRAVLDLDDVGLRIRDSGSDLLFGRFDKFTTKPDIDHEVRDGVALIKVAKRSGTFLGGAIRIDDEGDRDWNLRFSESVPLELECIGEDADIHLNMSTTLLEQLRLEADDSKIYLRLGDLVPSVKVSIKGRESSLELRVPENVGVKIIGEDYATYLDRLGLVEADEGSFVNDGFDTLQTKIEIDLDDELNSFDLVYF